LTLGRWIGLISLVISLYVLWQIRAIMLLFFMAIIFAVGLNRVVRQFQKSRLKRSAAIGLKIVIFIVVSGLLLALVATQITEQVDQLVELIPGAIAQVANLNYWLQKQIPGWKALEVLLLYFLIQQVEGNLITLVIMKQQVSLLRTTTLALLTASGTFFGVLGLPILVVAQIRLKEVWVKDILDRWTVPQEINSS
jgi:predicted PurR-regulated permease PerM